jgi:hypothetical protein
MAENRIERRKSKRVKANLKLEVHVPQIDSPLDIGTLETINISSSGVYFKSGHFIQSMTKLAMVLDVSVPASDGSGGVELAPVPCEGLVVRTNPETEVEGCDDYEIAVFFTHIEAEGAANLEKHINLLMEDSS